MYNLLTNYNLSTTLVIKLKLIVKCKKLPGNRGRWGVEKGRKVKIEQKHRKMLDSSCCGGESGIEGLGVKKV